MGAWLFFCLIIPCILLPFYVFSFVLWTGLGPLQLSAFGLTHYICGQPIDPWKSTSFVEAMVGRKLHLMMPYEMFLHPLQKMQGFMFCGSKLTFFHCLSTLFCWLMTVAHWLMSSLLIPLEQTWYHGRLFFVGWLQ
jgi:hypothetical protein